MIFKCDQQIEVNINIKTACDIMCVINKSGTHNLQLFVNISGIPPPPVACFRFSYVRGLYVCSATFHCIPSSPCADPLSVSLHPKHRSWIRA